MRYINKGLVIDHDDNDKEYRLYGVTVRGKDDGMVITGGSGYCLEVKKVDDSYKYTVQMVTEESLKGSVAIRTYVSAAAFLKNFTYTGDEEL